MKIERNHNWPTPETTIAKDDFEIDLSDGTISITCSWDFGPYGGNGTEMVSLPLHVLEEEIAALKRAENTVPPEIYRNLCKEHCQTILLGNFIVCHQNGGLSRICWPEKCPYMKEIVKKHWRKK